MRDQPTRASSHQESTPSFAHRSSDRDVPESFGDVFRSHKRGVTTTNVNNVVPAYSEKAFAVEIPNSGSTSTDLPGRRVAIVDPTQEPENGWYVLVKLAPEEQPTVRILEIEGGEMHFRPLNGEYAVATPPNPEILGPVLMISLSDDPSMWNER